jgi:hypothetical protein
MSKSSRWQSLSGAFRHLRHDTVTSLRFADTIKNGISGSELLVFEGCAHAAIYESVAEFNEKSLSFLTRHSG